MNRFAVMAAVAMVAAAASPSQAGVSTKQFLDVYDSEDGQPAAELQIAAMEQGLLELNRYVAKIRDEQPVYCQPEQLSLTGPQLADMVHRGVAENPKLKDQPLSVSLLAILQKTFPCPSN